MRRLPRLALLLLCAAYVLPGYLGREPWKNADMSAFGYMYALAQGETGWWQPRLLDLPPDTDGLLPFWLGAWAIRLAPAWIPADFAARLPFIALLCLTLAATWYATYYLARSPRAQPVAFAFGGEARPADYARAVADGGLLALLACLGLAQFAHETTPSLVQLAGVALAFYGFAALSWRRWAPVAGLVLGLSMLALSGAPSLALLLALAGAAGLAFERPAAIDEPGARTPWLRLGFATALALGVPALLATLGDEWRWRVQLPGASWREWRSLARLLLWFTWPALPLVLWTLWRWRGQRSSRHVLLPAVFMLVCGVSMVLTPVSDRSLLLALPAMATLAAFALPTLQRSVAALVDWFTLLFFTGCAVIIWVVWIAMQTGVPRQPAANVARLAPGFEPSFSWLAFALALLATLAWAWLVKWRVGRHRAALWKSLVLPAGGAVLSWLLLTTLWMPLLDFARSYSPLVNVIRITMGAEPGCVQVHGLSRGQLAAFRFHGQLQLRLADVRPRCNWLIVDADALGSLPRAVDMAQWSLQSTVRRPTDDNEDVLVYQRKTTP